MRRCLPLVFAAACVPTEQGELQLGWDRPEVEPGSALAETFADVADRWQVPADLLLALAYIETRMLPAQGEVEFDGQPPPWGLFALRGAVLEEAAALAGRSVEEVKTEPVAQVEAAAARLAALAEEAELPDWARDDALAWRSVVAEFPALDDPEMAEVYAGDVEAVLETGLLVPLEDGGTVLIGKNARFEPTGTTRSGLRASGTVWRPSPNFNSRGGRRPELVIIHTCEGAYAGCVSWLRRSGTGVSAHYVVREDGREVSQLVSETDRAWHIGAAYRSRLNGGRLSSREGISINTLSIGVEHGGFARTRTFDPNMIERSATLVREITSRHGIPRDRYHIVGHGQLQPENRTDPGPNWPWTTYLARINSGSPPPAPPPSNPPPSPPPPPSPSVVTVDNSDRGFSASSRWDRSSWAAGRIGLDYRFRRPESRSDPAIYRAELGRGRYEVFAWVPGNGYHPQVPYIVQHRGGQATVRRSQRTMGWVASGPTTSMPV